MSPIHQPTMRNSILAHMSAADFSLIAGDLEPLKCPRALRLVERGRAMPYVFFLENGAASIVARSPNGRLVEGGIIGREGFISPAVVLGSDRTPDYIEIQIPGSAHRIRRKELLSAVGRSEPMRAGMLRFAQVMAVQATATILTNAVNRVTERLARWLLMCHDRSDSDDLELTHTYMSMMLSVRRSSVTDALHILEGDGLVRTERGYVVIVNRSALQIFAGDAYGRPEAEYKRLLGPV